MSVQPEVIMSHFSRQGTFLEAKPFGNGHINDTFLITCDTPSGKEDYVLQRVNHQVFKDPVALMKNFNRATEHIRYKLVKAGVKDIDRRVLQALKCDDGSSVYVDADGNYWRLLVCIKNAITLEVVENAAQAYQTAWAFGNFQSMLADLPADEFHETIKDFHNGPWRYQQFLDSLEVNFENRVQTADTEVKFLKDHGWIFDVLPEMVAQGKIPMRITHNDTKINNVLLDAETYKELCVIDLDTIMPGISLYDFGDIARTSTVHTAEDEKDLSRVFLDLELYEGVVKGFIDGTAGMLNKFEISKLTLGAQMITLIMGTRFLADYLNGDVYYKTAYKDHNLDRCRTQFKLVQSMIENEKEMNNLVEKYASA